MILSRKKLHRKLIKVVYFIMAIGTIFSCYCVYKYPVHIRCKEYVLTASQNRVQKKNRGNIENLDAIVNRTVSKKYILLWTNSKYSPFSYFEQNSTFFLNRKCRWTNCYVTDNRNYLHTYTEFDVVAFNGPQLSMHIQNDDFPSKRSSHQKYVYANIESAMNYPVHDTAFNGYFNWTWTYKLNSDAVWGYMAIRDANGTVVGPKEHMHWKALEDMDPIDDHLKNKLRTKSRTAIWFSSNCNTQSLREQYVRRLQNHLERYGLELHIYGTCGPSQCPKNIMQRCLNMVRKHYYFYIAFENALSEDYVTEKILYALNYDTVPVVLGGANYTRFMPEGIYLDAAKLTPYELAQSMYEILQNSTRYYTFFKWRKYYSYHFRHESPETDDYCAFCKMVNNVTLMEKHSVYTNLTDWWMSGGPRQRALRRYVELVDK